jgi:hypothetical protein
VPLRLSHSDGRCLRSNFFQPKSSDIELRTGAACRRRTVQIINHDHFEYSFKQQCHLLVAVEQGVRYDGETFVEVLAKSTIRNYSHKLIFVPETWRCLEKREILCPKE